MNDLRKALFYARKALFCARKAVSCAAGILLLIGAAACSLSPKTTITPTAEQPTSAVGTPPATAAPRPSPAPQEAPAGASDDVVITFVGEPYEKELYEPLMAEFRRQYPHITVQFVSLADDGGGGADYYRLLASKGDTFMLYGVQQQDAAGFLQDLTPLVDADPTFQPDDFWPDTLEACQAVDGRQAGIPVMVSLQGLFFDAEAFRAAGLPLPQPGWTWDDFRKDALALAQQDGGATRYAYAENFSTLVEPLIEAALEANDGEIDPLALGAELRWYLDLVQVKAIRPALYYEDPADVDWSALQNEWVGAFQTAYRPVMWVGSLDMAMPGMAMPNMATSSEDPAANLAFRHDGLAPYPIAADGSNDHTTPGWVQCLAMSAGTQHPHEAWAWLSFLSRQRLAGDQNQRWSVYNPPARISVTEAVGFWDHFPAELQPVIRFMLDHAWYGTHYPAAARAVSDALTKAADALTKAAATNINLVDALEAVRNQLASAETTPTPEADPIVMATPKPTLSAEGIELNFYVQAWGTQADALTTLIAAYQQEHPDVAINWMSDYAAASEDWLSDMAATFDCFVYEPFFLDFGYSNGAPLLRLDALVEAEGGAFLEDFDPALLEMYRYQGELIGMPFSSQPPLIAYNADLLARRGLEPPAPDWTFDDFIDLATRASSTLATDRTYGLVTTKWDQLLLAGRGAEAVDFSTGVPVPQFDGPEFSGALAWIDGLADAGVVLLGKTGPDNDFDVRYQALLNGQIAFWETQAGQPAGESFGEDEPAFQWGIAPMPVVDDPQSLVNWNTETGFYISSNSKHPQACWDWYKFLSRQPGGFRGIPARKSTAHSPAWEASVGQEFAEVYRLAAERVGRFDPAQNLTNPLYVPLYTWQTEIIEAMARDQDYESLLAPAQQRGEAYLLCIGEVSLAWFGHDQLWQKADECSAQVGGPGN